MNAKGTNRSVSIPLECVVLFDIDGTLLAGPSRGPSAGFQSMMRAIVKVAGQKGEDPFVDFAGRTDIQIARALLQSSGVAEPNEEEVRRVVEAYLDFLVEEIADKPYQAIGSPADVTFALRDRGAFVGLGTGNVRNGGKIKLDSAGLGHLFDWSKGGFGDDGESRADLLAFGARSFDPQGELPVVIIGDTPRDIEAAHAIDAWCIGIPYLHNDAATLQKAGADALISDIDSSLVAAVENLIGKGA